jgi:acetyl-CoA synthetase
MTEVILAPELRGGVEWANVTQLMRGHGIAGYCELLRRSKEEPEWSWPAAVDEMGLEFSEPWQQVFRRLCRGRVDTWFVGAKLSIARNCVHRWAESKRADDVAAVFPGEDGAGHELTFAELSHEVTVPSPRASGRSDSDRETSSRPSFLCPPRPRSPPTHAPTLGAIQVPFFSGFVAHAVAARLTDSGAKVVVMADGSLHRGRELPMKETIDEALTEVPGVEHVVVSRRLGRGDVPMQARRDVYWDALVEGKSGELPALQVDSEAPYLLAYASGTTGQPKGVVHVQGGLLVSITREVAYEADATPDDMRSEHRVAVSPGSFGNLAPQAIRISACHSTDHS